MNDHIKFHHYGLALKTFKDAIRFHENLGYSCGKEVFDELQNVMLLLCTSNTFPTVELVKPVDETSPISNYLNKNNEMIYHICYEIDTIKISINEFFAQNRFICMSKPKPAILFNNRLVSFYYLNNVGLIEILEK
jgi:methylmalonyl-CoA/ethylmalonyl-CoA epimerase